MTLNCLLITCDQWRGDCLSLASHPCVRTPRIDALARDGVAFRRHFGQATPCGPARASLHTGLYAANHRSITNGTPLDHRHKTMAQILRREGLDPVLFGYTDTSIDPRTVDAGDPRLRSYEGLAPGFRSLLYLPESMRAWLDHLGRTNETVDAIYEKPLGEPADFPAERSETAFVTDRFIEWLHAAPRQPWVAHISLIKPHPPWIAAEPYHSLVPRGSVPAPRRRSIERESSLHPWMAWHLATPYKGWLRRAIGSPAGLDDATITEIRAIYFGLIAEIDHHIGRLLDTLVALGQLDDTLVLLTSDHGEMLGDHNMLGKSGFFPQAFHIPLIIRDPRCPTTRGRQVTAWTEHVDIMPTILDRLGVSIPRQCDGRSLSPFLTGGEAEPWRQAVHYEHDFREIRSAGHRDAVGLTDDECGITVQLGDRDAYVHFSGLPSLAFDTENDLDWITPLDDPARILASAEAMLSWRARISERRLSGAQLTEKGVIGEYDSL